MVTLFLCFLIQSSPLQFFHTINCKASLISQPWSCFTLLTNSGKTFLASQISRSPPRVPSPQISTPRLIPSQVGTSCQQPQFSISSSKSLSEQTTKTTTIPKTFCQHLLLQLLLADRQWWLGQSCVVVLLPVKKKTRLIISMRNSLTSTPIKLSCAGLALCHTIEKTWILVKTGLLLPVFATLTRNDPWARITGQNSF